MSVTAPSAALAPMVSAPAPAGSDTVLPEVATAGRGLDLVAFSPVALLHQLLAPPSAALRQLAALLPLVEGAVRADQGSPAPVPLGQLASAAGEAARQVGAGFGAVVTQAAATLPAGPAPAGLEPIERWREDASATLQDAANLLQRAEHRLGETAPGAVPEAPAPPSAWVEAEAAWALGQVAAAQREVAWAQYGLAPAFSPVAAGRRGGLRRERPGQLAALAGPVALIGAALLTLLLWLAAGWWLAVAAVAGLLATIAAGLRWGWRLGVRWRGLRIELRR